MNYPLLTPTLQAVRFIVVFTAGSEMTRKVRISSDHLWASVQLIARIYISCSDDTGHGTGTQTVANWSDATLETAFSFYTFDGG